MLEPLLGTRRHKRGIPEAVPGFSKVETTPYASGAWFGGTKTLYAEKNNSEHLDGGHSGAISYDGRYIAAPRIEGGQTFIYDISQNLSGYRHQLVGTIPDGGAISGSIDLDIIWFQDMQNSTTLRQWRRTVNLPSGMEYELVRTVPLDAKTSVQSQTDTPVISKDGNTVWTGKFIRKYDESGLVEQVNIGDNILNVLINETGKRFVTFKSTTEIEINVWEKSDSDGSWSIKASTTYPATFTKRVVSDTETTYLMTAGNYDLSRFTMNVNRDLIMFNYRDNQLTIETTLKSNSTNSNPMEFTYDRSLMCFNRSGNFFAVLTRATNGNSNKNVERYALNPANNTWVKSTAAAYAGSNLDCKHMCMAISGDSAIFYYAYNHNDSTGNNSGIIYSVRSIVNGKPTW